MSTQNSLFLEKILPLAYDNFSVPSSISSSKPLKPDPYVVNERVIVCGNFVEHYYYYSPYIKGLPKIPYYSGSFVSSFRRIQTVILENNVRRSRTKIRRLVNSNPDLNKFLTLTFRENMGKITDFNFTNTYFTNFIKRIKRFYPDFKYLAVPEFQGDYYFRTGIRKENGGAVHYHLLTNLPYIDVKFFEDSLWRAGHCRLNMIDKVDNVGAYISKYLGKESFNSRLFGKKKFFYSRDLVMPLIIDKLEDLKDFFNFFDFSCLKKLFSMVIDSEHFGMIEYTQYSFYTDFFDLKRSLVFT